jgi:hypothetical protein
LQTLTAGELERKTHEIQQFDDVGGCWHCGGLAIESSRSVPGRRKDS